MKGILLIKIIPTIILFTVIQGCSSNKIYINYNDSYLITKKDYEVYSGAWDGRFDLQEFNKEEKFILINFTSNIDLIKSSIENSAMIKANMFFCRNSDAKHFLSFDAIFHKKKILFL